MENIKPQVEYKINHKFNQRFLAPANLRVQYAGMTNKTKEISVLWRVIDEALKRQNKTQDWLAERVSVSNNAVTKWKQSGKISRENAIKIAGILDIPLDKLLRGQSNPFMDALDELPLERRTTILTGIMYQIEHADDVLAADKIAQYSKTMNKFIGDMKKRKT